MLALQTSDKQAFHKALIQMQLCVFLPLPVNLGSRLADLIVL